MHIRQLHPGTTDLPVSRGVPDGFRPAAMTCKVFQLASHQYCFHEIKVSEVIAMRRLGKQQHQADITHQRTSSGSVSASTCPTREAAWPRALSPSSQLLLLDLVQRAVSPVFKRGLRQRTDVLLLRFFLSYQTRVTLT
jgi:hypothetical protein